MPAITPGLRDEEEEDGDTGLAAHAVLFKFSNFSSQTFSVDEHSTQLAPPGGRLQKRGLPAGRRRKDLGE